VETTADGKRENWKRLYADDILTHTNKIKKTGNSGLLNNRIGPNATEIWGGYD